jgi:hypothetical protein
VTTTEYVAELEDADGDIVESEYYPTEREARAYAGRLIKEGETPSRIKLARVTNTWDARDRDDLLDRQYEYLTPSES